MQPWATSTHAPPTTTTTTLGHTEVVQYIIVWAIYIVTDKTSNVLPLQLLLLRSPKWTCKKSCQHLNRDFKSFLGWIPPLAFDSCKILSSSDSMATFYSQSKCCICCSLYTKTQHVSLSLKKFTNWWDNGWTQASQRWAKARQAPVLRQFTSKIAVHFSLINDQSKQTWSEEYIQQSHSFE